MTTTSESRGVGGQADRISPTQANNVLGVFFDEMEKRHWSTAVSDITSAQQATLTHFRWSSQGV